jgi:uncharacterized protein YfdQ (DUF2303 family)
VSSTDYAAEAAVVEDAVRRAEARRAVPMPDGYTLPEGVSQTIIRDDEDIATKDVEQLAARPRETRGTAELHDGASFIAYVTRLHSEATTLWACPPKPADPVKGTRATAATVTAVFNDHAACDRPGWRDHRATLTVQDDLDWAAWRGMDGKLVGQKDFAQFLLDHAHNIKAPSPARLMPAVLQFQAARNATYESGVNLDNGEIRMSYVEEVKNSGKGRQNVALPQTITLGLYPFAGAVEASEAYEVEARVRYKIPAEGGELQIGVKLTRPDFVVQQAWDKLSAEIAAGVPSGVLTLQGVAPESLR